MIQKIVDLHIHSKFSRACSKDLELSKIAKTCEEKGIEIVATGDFTHPIWFKNIKEQLEEVAKSGLFKLKSSQSSTRFIIGTEISCVSIFWCLRQVLIRQKNLLTHSKNMASIFDLMAVQLWAFMVKK